MGPGSPGCRICSWGDSVWDKVGWAKSLLSLSTLVFSGSAFLAWMREPGQHFQISKGCGL